MLVDLAAAQAPAERVRGHNAVTSDGGHPGIGRDRLGRAVHKCPAQRHVPGSSGIQRDAGLPPHNPEAAGSILPPLPLETLEILAILRVSSCSGATHLAVRGHDAVTSAVVEP